MAADAKPEPISKPFTAPMEKMAFARTASSLSKTVSPMPAGMPVTTHSMTPPEESFSDMHCFRYSCAFAAASASGMYRGFLEISASSKRCPEMETGPMDLV